MSDDDEDGEWVDVHHSSDEDTGEIVRGRGSCVPSCYTSDGIMHVYMTFHYILTPGSEAAEYS